MSHISGVFPSPGQSETFHNRQKNPGFFEPSPHSVMATVEDISVILSGQPQLKYQPSKSNDSNENLHIAHELAEGFKKDGADIVKSIEGDFSLAIYNPSDCTGVIAIDRMGVGDLYYAQIGQNLYFGDLKHITRNFARGPEINQQALFAYFYFHMIPAPLSIYEGVNKLLPGQYLLWDGKQFKLDFYWRPSFTDSHLPESDLIRNLRTTLKEAVESNVKSPAATGSFLSGGLDSSTISGLYKEISPNEAKAFSIGFDAEGYDEMAYARSAAKHFNLPIHEYYVTPGDVVKAIPKIAAFYEEPFGNASAIPAYYCALLAKNQGVQTLLAGDGGDELFAGNERYAKQKMFALYDRIPSWLQSILIEPLVNLDLPVPLLGKLKSYVTQARTPMPERMETYNFLHRMPLAEIFEEDYLSTVDSGWPIGHLKAVYETPETDSMLKRMLYLDWKITLADNDLRKVNRMCRLAGVDVRYPMLQDPVVSLAAQIPDRLLMRGFELRSFYRRAFKDFLPSTTLEKRKHGFGLPFGLWLQSDPALQALANDSLNSPHLSGIVKKSFLQTLKSQHQQSHASYYGVMIWVLMMWAQWAEQHG